MRCAEKARRARAARIDGHEFLVGGVAGEIIDERTTALISDRVRWLVVSVSISGYFTSVCGEDKIF